MKLLTRAIAEAIPPLYAQDGKGDDAIVHVKFFDPAGSWTWYATEASAVDEHLAVLPGNAAAALHDGLLGRGAAKDVRFFGLVDGHEAELGYWSLLELASIRTRYGLGIERDMHFQPKRLGEIRTALRAAGSYGPGLL